MGYGIKECECGCGEIPNKGRLFVQGHNKRPWVTGKPVDDYLVDDNDCWVWQKTKSNSHGVITTGKDQGRLAHRVYYERHRGNIPAGDKIDHRCGNPLCVNPVHLEAVSRRVSVRRSRRTKLSADDVAMIRHREQTGDAIKAIANDYSVSSARISQITRGRDKDRHFADL